MVNTLGGVADDGWSLRIWCNRRGCGHQADMSGAAAAELLGRETPVYGCWEKLCCSKCGASGARRGDIFAMAIWPDVPKGLGRG